MADTYKHAAKVKIGKTFEINGQEVMVGRDIVVEDYKDGYAHITVTLQTCDLEIDPSSARGFCRLKVLIPDFIHNKVLKNQKRNLLGK